MGFKSVIGQAQVKQHLIELVRLNRLSHALLFLGPEGSGALPMALAFAQYVVCERAKGDLGDACGICASCVKASQLIHPDIHFSYPVIPKKAGDKPVSTDYISEWREFVRQYPYGNAYDWLQFIGAENKQGNISAHECNEINRKLSLKSFESGYKILIMWMPEYLGNEGNKLLKLIEEPPPDTLFVLVTENEAQILSTILSRVQIIRLPKPQVKEIQEALVSRAGVQPEQARQLAAVSEQNYREALRQLQHGQDDWQSLLREWLNAVFRSGP